MNCYSILIEAVSKNQLELVSSLIKNSKETQQYINFALFKAAQLGHLEIFAYLVSKGGNIYWQNNAVLKTAINHKREDITDYIFITDCFQQLNKAEESKVKFGFINNQKVKDYFTKYNNVVEEDDSLLFKNGGRKNAATFYDKDFQRRT
jgi:hypothetical protein